MSFYSDKKCVVSGGTGMIGRQVCRLLVEQGAKVRSFSLDRIRPVDGVEYWHGDLCDTQQTKVALTDADFVFHVAGMKAAAQITWDRPASFFVPLLQMNTNVLAEVIRIGARCLYVSSIGAYAADYDGVYCDEGGVDMFDSQPMDFYPGWAKRMGELQCRAYAEEYGEHFAVVRPSNVYGPGDRFGDGAMVIPALIRRTYDILKGGGDKVEVYGDGSGIRDFVHSSDVARGILLAMEHGTYPGFINLGGMQDVTISDLCYSLSKITGARYRFGEKPGVRRTLTNFRARDELGWVPTVDLYTGLAELWTWYQDNRCEPRKDYFG